MTTKVFNNYEDLEVFALVKEDKDVESMREAKMLNVKMEHGTKGAHNFPRVNKTFSFDKPGKDFFLIETKEMSGKLEEMAAGQNHIQISPTAQVVPFEELQKLGDKIDPNIAATFSKYDYYRVVFGFNVILAKNYSIPDFVFKIVLTAGDLTDPRMVCYDGFPHDTKEVAAIGTGTAKLGFSELFKVIPVIGPLASKVIDADFNFAYKWNYTKSEVQFAGALDYDVRWSVRGGTIAGEFTPLIILKIKKGLVSEVSGNLKAKVDVGYHLDPPESRDNWFGTMYFESKQRDVLIEI